MLGLGEQEWMAVALSLKVSFWATICCLPVALWIAFVLARKDFFGKSVLNALTFLPLVMPPVVTGYLLLMTFGTQGLVGSALQNIGIVFAFRWTGAALAAAVMALPLMVRAMRLGFEAIDPRLEEAAQSLGGSPFWVFVSVTLPLSGPAILAAMVLGFAKALGEFGATITFVAAIPGETQTLPTAIYSFLQIPGGETAAVPLVIISIGIALVAVLASEWLASRMRKR